MVKQKRRGSNHKPRHLTLPELDQSKTSVLNTLGSLQSRRSYQHAMDEFIAWYCSEPRLAFESNRRLMPDKALFALICDANCDAVFSFWFLESCQEHRRNQSQHP
ncbi:MAG: hypothetical protein DMG24_16270 [Acidobacteria bacterium]|nr:MAG: hypothetical protein DMG24_16270 [Acidobacteriota bacterium]